LNFPFVIVYLDDARLALAEESGFLFVKSSATEEETLQSGDSVIIIGRVHSLPPALRGEVERLDMA